MEYSTYPDIDPQSFCEDISTSDPSDYGKACQERARVIELESGASSPSLEDQIVEELNQKLAIVHTSTTYILIEKNEIDFALDSKPSIITLFENDRVEIDGKLISKVQIWLKSPRRRSYDEIVFNPRISGHYESKYNIWKGFAVSAKGGDCGFFWRHIHQVICSGKDEHYQYVRKWLAHLIQKPWDIGSALVLRGKQGTGKGIFVETIGRLLGPHYAPLASLDRVLGRFNSHLKHAILIFADEAIWGGNKKEVGALKALITEPKLFIEGKGKDGYWIDNYKHLIVSSNEDWVVHLDPDDRRFFVLDVSDIHKEDQVYFGAIIDQLEKGGYEALMHDLLQEDLNGFELRKMPENFSGFDMKLASTSSADRFIYTSLKEGCWDHANTGPSGEIQNLIISKFYTHYREWCEWEKDDVMPQAQLGKRLHQIIPGIEVKRSPSSEGATRPNYYQFPPLDTCRSAFEQFYKQNPAIWELS